MQGPAHLMLGAVIAMVAHANPVASPAEITAAANTVLSCSTIPDYPATPLLNPPDCPAGALGPAMAIVWTATAKDPIVGRVCAAKSTYQDASWRAGFCTGIIPTGQPPGVEANAWGGRLHRAWLALGQPPYGA